jgi:hypothetical protein
VGRGKRKRELQRAEGAYDMQVQRFENIDTSNPYANQENVYDDATVNLQGADYAKQQAMQGQANMQDTFGQAAGGSGIASLAQVMSQQQGQQAQRSSVMIGEQEQKNQQQQMMEGARLQDQNIEGQMMSRQMESDKGQSLMSMAGQDLSKARMDKAMHDNMALAGVTGAVGGAMSKYAPMKA